MGHHIDAEISPKAASEKAQTMMSEARYIVHLSRVGLIFPGQLCFCLERKQGSVQVSFLAYQVQHSCLVSLSVYAIFFLRMSVQFCLVSDDY